VHLAPGVRDPLATLAEVPLTFGGAAPYNVRNALGAAALAHALGLPRDAIVGALRTFGREPTDNPGRGQLVELGEGVRALLDFGHNPAGIRELFTLARTLVGEGSSVLAVTTLAGDRSDADYAAFARALVQGGVTRVVVWEKPALLRGRAAGEPRALLRRELVRAGLADEAVLDGPDEAEATALARGLARAGDLVVVAPHLDR
jgi:cyanophycin synthetase